MELVHALASAWKIAGLNDVRACYWMDNFLDTRGCTEMGVCADISIAMVLAVDAVLVTHAW
jgi:hypothetical protein